MSGNPGIHRVRISDTEDEFRVNSVSDGRDGEFRLELDIGYTIDVDSWVYGREPRVGDIVRMRYMDSSRNSVLSTVLAPQEE